MPNIRRTTFNRELQNKSLDAEKLKQDDRLQGVDVDAADINNDGKISGQNETDKLYLEIDNFDRNGTYSSMDMGNKEVRSRVGAVADQANSEGLKRLVAQARTGIGDVQNNDRTNPQAMVDAASALVRDRAQAFGVEDPWINSDPNHALPANVKLGGLKGTWKCNLFAGNAMYDAGFKPPYYGNRGKGEYPNANQLYKWSDKFAGQYGNKTHFELKGDLTLTGMTALEKQRAIEKLLENAEPGDMIIADHIGDDIADGGHCRVLIKKNDDGTFEAAQASSTQAETQTENWSDLANEERLWILRPNNPR